jgi:hypothetical protein
MIGLDDGEIDDSLITNNAIESDYNLIPQVHILRYNTT